MDNALLAALLEGGSHWFTPVRASACGRCGLSTRAEVFVRLDNQPATPGRQGCSEPLCHFCRLGAAPVEGSITLAVLPEFSQSELNVLCTALALAMFPVEHSAVSPPAERREPLVLLWAAFQARARDTQALMPFTASVGLLAHHLQALAAPAREEVLTALADLRYLPDLDYPPTAAYFEKLRVDSAFMAWVRPAVDPALQHVLNGQPAVVAAQTLTRAGVEVDRA